MWGLMHNPLTPCDVNKQSIYIVLNKYVVF